MAGLVASRFGKLCGLLDEAHYPQHVKVVDKQLALVGFRLAAVLNELLGRVSPQEFRH